MKISFGDYENNCADYVPSKPLAPSPSPQLGDEGWMRMMKMRMSDGDYENADYVPSKPLSLLLLSLIWDEDE